MPNDQHHHHHQHDHGHNHDECVTRRKFQSTMRRLEHQQGNILGKLGQIWRRVDLIYRIVKKLEAGDNNNVPERAVVSYGAPEQE